MSELKCKDCQYYQQHYGFDNQRIFRMYCGHCCFSCVKRTRPDTKACKHFVLGTAVEDTFVSKEYLSKELLRYMLTLDLLPRIEDSAAPPDEKT